MSEHSVTLDGRDLDLIVRALMAQSVEYRRSSGDPAPRGLYARTQSDRSRNLGKRLAGLYAPVLVTGARHA